MALLITASQNLYAGEAIVLAPDFAISVQHEGLIHPTQITFGPDGRLYVGVQSGQIYAFDYTPRGVNGGAALVASGVGNLLLGIGFDSTGSLYASSNEGTDDSGFLARMRDTDGDGFFETIDKFVTGLPNRGHHNDQLAIDGRTLYVGMGSRNDDGDVDDVSPIPAATMLRVDLDAVDFLSSSNLPTVYARGLRNPFGVALDAAGRLWCADNGRDSPLTQETLHRIMPHAHHGFPAESAPSDAIAPITTLGLGTSANGFDFYPSDGRWGTAFSGNIFLTRFDFELNDPEGIGQDVVRIMLDEATPGLPKATVDLFARGLRRPLDAEIDPYGNLLIMEYGSYSGAIPGRIQRIAALIGADHDRDSDVDMRDVAALQTCFAGTFAPEEPSNCATFDSNVNHSIDFADVLAFLAVFAGT
ncbi:MAG: sorbosone dehydrogenase family protein [Phycisphaerae bacterium]